MALHARVRGYLYLLHSAAMICQVPFKVGAFLFFIITGHMHLWKALYFWGCQIFISTWKCLALSFVLSNMVPIPKCFITNFKWFTLLLLAFNDTIFVLRFHYCTLFKYLLCLTLIMLYF